MKGRYEVMDSLLREFPDLRIEGCDGGATNFDWGTSVRTHSTWLSDHYADPEVSRFQATGALRFWPAHFLNCCVPAFLDAGDKPNLSHEILSRMVGALSFNGDIADWSTESTAIARRHVEVFKQIRPLMVQPVFFPLDQPRSILDWDVVLYGDGSGEGQLLYAFRVKGDQQVLLPDMPGKGPWKQLLGSPEARLEKKGNGCVLHLPERASALWRR